ncbi:hypothetical protein MESS4_20052 [Mesorhizobium sp. STM 4661]|nr:hypothetical protein MESS4_20052 [Mesorhizobium sp. STM 4661]
MEPPGLLIDLLASLGRPLFVMRGKDASRHYHNRHYDLCRMTFEAVG